MIKPTGFKAIVGRETHWLSRIFWLLVFILLTSWLTYLSYQVIWKYNYEPDFGVKVFERPMRDIPFPAVTTCGPTFAKNNLANYLKLGNIFKSDVKLTVKEQNYFAASYQVCNQFNELGDYDLVMTHLRNRTDFDIIKLLNESTLTVKKIVPFCGINGERSSSCDKHFKQILTEKGFCYNFNMLKSDSIYTDAISDVFKPSKSSKIKKYLTKVFGKFTKIDEKTSWTLDDGYSLNYKDNEPPYRATKRNRFGGVFVLSHENAENACLIIGKVFHMLLHMPNEIPTVFNDEYFIQYDFQKTLYVTATLFTAHKDLRRYSPNIRGCFFQNERKLKFYKQYTKSLCDYECLTNYTLESCGCVKFSMPHEQNTPICDITHMKCVAAAIDRWPEENEENHYACNCLMSCNYIKYAVRYEKESAIDSVKGMLGPYYKNFTGSVTGVRFVEHLVMEHQKFISYSLENFIADVGGLLGLMVGASIVSFIEIIYGLFHLGLYKINRKKQVEIIETNNHEQQAVKIQKLIQAVQLMDQQQKESNLKISNLEEKIEKLKQQKPGRNDEIILKSLEEIIFNNRKPQNQY